MLVVVALTIVTILITVVLIVATLIVTIVLTITITILITISVADVVTPISGRRRHLFVLVTCLAYFVATVLVSLSLSLSLALSLSFCPFRWPCLPCRCVAHRGSCDFGAAGDVAGRSAGPGGPSPTPSARLCQRPSERLCQRAPSTDRSERLNVRFAACGAYLTCQQAS